MLVSHIHSFLRKSYMRPISFVQGRKLYYSHTIVALAVELGNVEKIEEERSRVRRSGEEWEGEEMCFAEIA